MQLPGARSVEGGHAGQQCVGGLRRVDWVRLYRDGECLRAEAVGMGFRLPMSAPIPVAMAARLIAAGIPSVVVHEESDAKGPVAQMAGSAPGH